MDKPTSLIKTLPRLMVVFWLTAVTAGACLAVDGAVDGDGAFVPEIPATYSGSGSFFNRQLGTAFRFSYHNEGYGTQEGVVTLGTMKVFNGEGSTIFLDGQATLSDEFGGGFNAGVGYRTLNDLGFGFDSRRINGVNFWTDGQSTSADNFFTQLGVGLESLGDSVDLRLQGYFPLDRIKDGDRETVSGSTPVFEGDALLGALQQFARDTALTVVDFEGAKRIANLEAWGFLGGYHLSGSEFDATGYRAGVRGYAVPDLALSVQVTDDDIYHTNVMFAVTWFVGRTHRLNAPCGTLLDRFREPVLRNDFIATTQQIIDDPITPLTDAVSGDQFVFVHVDSSAPAGGDGSFENPFNSLLDAQNGSGENSIVFVHSGSVLAGSFVAQDGQRILGEGLDQMGNFVDHVVNSAEQGIVSLPPTSLGSQMVVSPTINGVGIVFDLADNNEVNNFVINGGVTAVNANAVASPQLANLDINSPTGDAIVFTDVTGSSLVENSVTIDDAGGRGMVVDGGSGVLGANAVITNTVDRAVEISGRGGGSVTVGEIHQIAGGQGIYVHDNTGGTITFSSQAEVTTSGADSAVELENNMGTTITFQELEASSDAADTFVVTGGGTISVNDPNDSAFINNTGAASALVVRGDGVATGNPTVNVAANISNTGGGLAVDIQQMTGGGVTITGDVTDTDMMGSGILVQDNTAGTYSFSGNTTLDTGANNAVVLQNNTGATVNFTNLIATATDGDTFTVIGGGTVNVNDPNDTAMIINNGNGTAVVVLGDDDPTGVDNPTVNIAANVMNTVGGMSVNIEDMTGGGVTFTGMVDDMDGGVLIQNNTGGSFIFTDTLTVDTGNNDAVALLSNTGATLSFNGLDINATGAAARGFVATGGGTLIVSNVNDTMVTSEMAAALQLDGMSIGAGNVTFDMVNQTAGTTTGVILRNLTGTASVTVGADPNMPGTIISSNGGVLVDGGANNITINTDITTSGGESLEVINRTGGTVTFNGEINDTGAGMNIANNTGGSINITDELTFNTGANDAITIAGNNGAAIDFTGSSSIDLGTTTATGIHLTGTNTNVDFDPNVSGGTGTTVEVEGVATATFDGNITNVAGQSVHVHDRTGGTVAFNGDVNDTGDGVLIESNTGGTVNFTGDVTLNTDAGDALTIQGNAAAHTTTFSAASQLDIDTTSGDGVVINGPGTVNILGTGNTVDSTTTGVGIDVTNGGATTINNTTVNTAGDNAVNVSHTSAAASDVNLNSLTVASAVGNIGVNVSANGTGEFDLTMANVNISGVGQEGILFDTGASADRVDFTLTDSLITAVDSSAFLATLNDSNTADVRYLIDRNQFSNNSGTAGTDSATVDISVTSGMTLNATIGNGPDNQALPTLPIGDRNRFVNSSADGDAFLIEIADGGAGGTLNLDLRDNTAQSGDIEFGLTQTSGAFNLVDATDTINGLNNQGTVTTSGTINNIAPPLLLPTP